MPKRHEIFLVAKCLHDGQILLVEGLNPATYYFNDGIVRHKPGTSGINIEIIEDEFAVIFYNQSDSLPWHGQISNFTANPGYRRKKDELETIIFVASYGDTKERMKEGFEFAFRRVDELLKGAKPRHGETRVK